METNDKLLYGKSGLKRVVGLEITDDKAEVYQQDSNGNVTSILMPHEFWILSSDKVDKQAIRLSGDLHYKYAKRFHNRKQFEINRSMYRNAGHDVYSIYNAEEAHMVKTGVTFYRDMQPKELSLLSFDLETTGLDGSAADAKILLISATYRDHRGVNFNMLLKYNDYTSEANMINAFCKLVCDTNPTLIVGHNIISYDFPYLAARAKATGATLNLGRNGSEVEFNSYKSKFRLDGTRNLEYNNIKIYGREIVDTYFLAVSFDVSKSMESYGLKPLIKQLGFEKEGRQYYDAGSIRINYKDPVEWQKICNYAIDDAEDAVKIWDHCGPLYFNMCPFTPKPFSEVLLSASGSKINGMMVRSYLQDGRSIPKADETVKYAGALSWGKPGVYKNVMKVDCQSMYPSIIINCNVYDSDKDVDGHLLQFVKFFRSKRMEYKKLAAETGDNYWKQMDTTMKSYLNSFYGFFGASGLNFNNFECADFITKTGREILSTAIVWATSKDFNEIAPEFFETHENMEEQ